MTSRFTMSLGLVLASVLLMAATPESGGPSVLVQTVKLRQGSLPRLVTVYGTVQADPSARATIVAPLAASVAALYARTGIKVAKGAALLLLVPSPQTSASYAQALSALQVASDSVTRTRELLAESLATKQQLADAAKAQSDARALLTALTTQGAGVPTTLRAPFDAIVTAISASERAIVTEGSPLLELARLNGLALMAGVVPDQAGAIAAGDKASVTAVGDTAAYPAKVLSRGSVVAADSGLVPVQISLPLGVLLPGESAQADITVGTVSGYVVPHQAILVDDDGNTYVVQAIQGIAKIVHVRTLNAQANNDTIDGPLDAAAPLVLAGNHQLQDGMRVRTADTNGDNR